MLPQKRERSKASVTHFWRRRKKFSDKVENRKEYLHFEDKNVAKKVRNQGFRSKRIPQLQKI